MQSLPTSEQVDTLHLLRLGGGAARPDLEAQVGAEAVSALVDDGLATATAARVSLTPAGRQAHEAALAADLDERGVRSHVDACYQRFLVLNAEVLALCTDWQVRTDGGAPAINDHSDPAYDDAVVARLGAVSARPRPCWPTWPARCRVSRPTRRTWRRPPGGSATATSTT